MNLNLPHLEGAALPRLPLLALVAVLAGLPGLLIAALILLTFRDPR